VRSLANANNILKSHSVARSCSTHALNPHVE